LAADSSWNGSSQLDTFLHGLADPIKDQLAPLDIPFNLDAAFALVMRIDTRLMEREKHKEGLGRAAVRSCQGCFQVCVCVLW